MAGLARTLLHSQFVLCEIADRLLPERFRVDGHQHYRREFAWEFVRPGMTVYDIGGGKYPFVSTEQKRALGLKICGLDIDAGELASAPVGSYDEVICSDVTQHKGRGDADLVVCQATLEHVTDNRLSMAALASILKPGGIALIFTPSRNAAYARLNLLLPEGLKKNILNAIFPEGQAGQGFPPHYDRCTPQEFRKLAQSNGFEVLRLRTYFISSYFAFFFPIYLVWRLWVLIFYALARDNAAEAFSVALRKSAPFEVARQC
jgi:SAM-dependent methyltransferase